ncbi:MAG: CcmD family protein [Acidobacteria bacterium]|nr:CcmD family protein [Acidobacteriota bacterium]
MKNLQSLMAAYLFVWGIFFVYHLTVAQRLARLQDEVKRLKEMLKQG